MKRSTWILALAAIAMIAAGVLLCGIAVAQGTDIRQLVEEGGLSVRFGDSQHAGDRGYTVCEEGEARFPMEGVCQLDVGWVAGQVEISVYDGDEIQVTETAARVLEENEKLRYQLNNGVLHLRYCTAGVSNLPAKTLTLLVPAALCLDELAVDVVSADVDIDSLAVDGDINCDGVSGDVEMRGFACRHLHISTVSGEARLSGAAERIEYSSTSGGMRAENLTAGCQVETDTVSGDIELSFAGCPGAVDGSSTSGEFTLRLPSDVGFQLDYDTVSGDLNCDFPGLKDVYGDQALFRIDVSTTSGDLTIRKK